jgi:hypothetical protein
MCHRLQWSHAGLWFLNVESDCGGRKRVTTKQVDILLYILETGRTMGYAEVLKSDILKKKKIIHKLHYNNTLKPGMCCENTGFHRGVCVCHGSG